MTKGVTRFTARDSEGKEYRWAFWYDNRTWFLRDYDGYVRRLNGTWIDSVPQIHLILSNHGMSAAIS